MDLPSVQARDLMSNRFDAWIDAYFLESIPEAFDAYTDKTVCLIQEWLSEPIRYANASFKGWEIGVEVQIFYKPDADVDSIDAEMSVAQLFYQNGWIIEQSKNHVKDPDTGQVTKTFYFSKKLMIGSELNGN